jgi:hypothetical protein
LDEEVDEIRNDNFIDDVGECVPIKCKGTSDLPSQGFTVDRNERIGLRIPEILSENFQKIFGFGYLLLCQIFDLTVNVNCY